SSQDRGTEPPPRHSAAPPRTRGPPKELDRTLPGAYDDVKSRGESVRATGNQAGEERDPHEGGTPQRVADERPRGPHGPRHPADEAAAQQGLVPDRGAGDLRGPRRPLLFLEAEQREPARVPALGRFQPRPD